MYRNVVTDMPQTETAKPNRSDRKVLFRLLLYILWCGDHVQSKNRPLWKAQSHFFRSWFCASTT